MRHADSSDSRIVCAHFKPAKQHNCAAACDASKQATDGKCSAQVSFKQVARSCLMNYGHSEIGQLLTEKMTAVCGYTLLFGLYFNPASVALHACAVSESF
jgi:hypothetical protein